MKLKTLKRKIERLEKRLQDGPRKLAKLKLKLEGIKAATRRKARRKSAARARAARQTATSSTPEKKKSQMKTVGAKQPTQKVKRKLNLSPERRAQLAAAMKARWAARRAASEANPKTDGDFTLAQTPQAPESRLDGA